MPDWKKEIKLSDLFKRSPKEKADPAVADEASKEPKKSFLKRDISFSRKPKDAILEEDGGTTVKLSRKEARAAKKEERAAAKAAKAESKGEGRRGRGRGERKQGPAVPAIPLMRAFNLLPHDEAAELSKRRATPAQLGIAVAALVGMAVLAAYFLMLNAKVADKRAEADSLRAAVAAKPHPAPQPQQSDTVDAALQQEQQARTAALAGALGHRIAWDRLLRDVSLVVPDSISLTKMTATGGGSKDATDPTVPPAPGTTTSETAVTLEGYSAKSGDDVAVFLSRLAVLPELSAVKLQTVTRAERGSHEVIQFVIEAVAKPATGATQ